MGKKGEAVTILVVIGLLALGAYTLLTVSSDSPTGLTGFQTGAITACGNIAASDNLTQDISSGSSCLNITASNVVIDCQGFTVNFNSGSGIGDIGIHAQSVNNITIRNCHVNDTGTGGTTVYGLAFDNVSNSVIENSNFSIRGGASDNAAIRINGDYTSAGLSSSNNNIIRNNIVFSNGSFSGEGIVVFNNASNNIIENNIITMVNVSNLGTCCSDAIDLTGSGSNNTIRNNTANVTKGRGLTLSSMTNSIVTNNQFNVSDASSFSAVVISGDTGSNISSNSIILTVSGDGVSFSSNTNTIFENNNLSLNVASSNSAVLASGTNTGSVIRNNNMTTTGATGSHVGVSFSGASSLTVFNNTITTLGVSGGNNYGVSLSSSASSNNISQNTIRTNSTGGGTGTNRGIFGSNADRNNIHDNIISTDGTIGSNEGIKLDGGSDANNVSRNNITTRGTGAGGNIGISLEFLADANIISYNIINTTGGGTNNHGIRLWARNVTTGGGGGGGASIEGFETESPNPATCNGGNPCESVSNNWIYRNVIRSNGTDISHGIFLISENQELGGGGGGASIEGFGTESSLNSLNTSVTGNLIQENNILSASHNNIDPSNGIQLSGINSSNRATNNTFTNNNISNTTGAGVMLALSSSGSIFNETRIINLAVWLNATASTSSNFTNTTFVTDSGIIKIFNFTFNGANSVLRTDVNITSNMAFVNSTAKSFLNQSAHITLTGLVGASHIPTVDFEDDGTFADCSAPQCTNIAYAGGTLNFDVASFTTYSSINVGGLSVNLSKSDSQDPVGNGSQLNYTIIFNVTNGTAGNVIITENYPANVSFVSASPSPNSSNNVWLPSNLTNSSFEINITVLVNSSAPNGSILNNTIVTYFTNSSGSNLSLNVSETTTVNVSVSAQNFTPTNVSVSKTDSPDPVNNGSQLNYTINVTVTQGNATNVTVVDTFPSGVTFNTSTPTNTSSGTWSLGNLTTNQSILINITVNVNSNASGTLVNSVNVSFQNATNSTNSVASSASTTVNTGGGGGGGGSGSGGGGSGGSGGVICPPLCQYPENANLPICINNCVRTTEPAEFPATQFPSFGESQDSSSGIDTSAGIPEPESIVEEAVETMEETPAERSGFAKFFPWLVLLVLIALLIAIMSRNRDGKSKPTVKVISPKTQVKANNKETQKILDDIRKSEERLKKLLGK